MSRREVKRVPFANGTRVGAPTDRSRLVAKADVFDTARPRQECPSCRTFRLDAQRIVDGDSELLFAPEIPLRRLDGHVPEQELNLLQFAAGQMALPGARAAQIVRCQLLYLSPGGSSLDHLPDHFGCHALAPDPARLVDGPEHISC